MVSTKPTSPDQIIENLGGCGRFQIWMGITVHITKTLISFSVMSTIMLTATPNWWCTDDNMNYNITSCSNSNGNNETKMCPEKMCFMNNTKCESFEFAGVRTLVSEFNLLCDLDYIPSTVMSLQAFGMLVGSLIAGQISDSFGRKSPYFAAILMVIVFNFIGFMSTNWIMFAVSRFFIGFGGGAFISVQHCILSEFMLAQWRPWITGFPSWPLQVCALALVSWLIKDWRYIQLFCCILGIPFLFTWFVIPESFRWFVAHDRPDDAKKIIERWAKINRKPVPELGNMSIIDDSERKESEKKYTLIHLFKSKELTKITLLLAIDWLALGMVFYAITFGIQALSGNIYLNLFLFSIAGIPTKIVALWMQNKFGRRISNVLCFIAVATSGFVVGVVQSIDANNKDILTNVFSILASVGINTAWGPVQTMTIEVYPTVVRNIGMGSMNTVARVGAIVGPQLVYLNAHVPGLMYYVCGVIGVLCILSQIGLPETKDSNLDDKFEMEEISS